MIRVKVRTYDPDGDYDAGLYHPDDVECLVGLIRGMDTYADGLGDPRRPNVEPLFVLEDGEAFVELVVS